MSEIVSLVFESRPLNAPQMETLRLETTGVLTVDEKWTEVRFPDSSPQHRGELALRFAPQSIELESRYERKNILKFSTLHPQKIHYETPHGTFEFQTEVLRHLFQKNSYMLHYRLWSGKTLIGEVQVQLTFRKE